MSKYENCVQAAMAIYKSKHFQSRLFIFNKRDFLHNQMILRGNLNL